MNSLKVSVVPLDITWADSDENLYAAESILRRLDKDTDVVVLPELFNTGFVDAVDILHKYAAEGSDSIALQRVKEWSARFNFAIAGTLTVCKDGTFYNRAFFIEPSGESTFYDKSHLFSLSTEPKVYEAGSEGIPVVRFRGWNIALAVCYEVRFPAWLRNNDSKYDVLIIPANWPARRAYAWQHLLIARAIENQSFVVGANRTGSDDSGHYEAGQSYILNYIGKPIHAEVEKLPGVITATMDRDKLHTYRSNFPFLGDADKFRFV